MTNSIKKIAVLTSGGDAPGMNAALRAVVRTALSEKCEVVGFLDGYKGLVEDNFIKMDRKSVANCIQRGGTILRTIRYPQFTNLEVRAQAIANLKKHNIDALVVLGGDGSFRGAKRLSEECNIKAIGIPCTIDNDIEGTEYTLGFDTACNTALQAIDKIRDTAFSHNRNFLVEVMGRSAGFLALDVGIAGGAEFILVPEMHLTTDDLIDNIANRPRYKMGSIIVVAEASEPGRSFGIAQTIADKLNIEYKVCVLGHIQRGGTPSVRDRKVASLMGFNAIQALLKGHSKKMIAYVNEQCVEVDIPEADTKPRRLTNTDILQVNNVLCDL
jgi:6-phosphofructokinase 1